MEAEEAQDASRVMRPGDVAIGGRAGAGNARVTGLVPLAAHAAGAAKPATATHSP